MFKRLLILPVCLGCGLLTFAQSNPVPYTVQTLAGSAIPGDGGTADSAVLRFPNALAFDAAGNLYIADQGNASIRKVTPAGIISTVAGTGQSGFGGDAGPAATAQLGAVIGGLAFDAAGNLYVSDSANHAIRRIGKDGNINTFVSGASVTGLPFWPNGLAFDKIGNLYVADGNNAQVYRVAQDGSLTSFAGNGKVLDAGDGGPAAVASFVAPYGLFVDAAGSVFVADLLASRIRKVTTDGVVNAFAGTGQAGMSGDGATALQAQLVAPMLLAGDNAGNLYVTDSVNHNIREIATDGTITTIAGGPNPNATMLGDGGPATLATIQQATGIAISPSGTLYFSDSDSSVRMVTATGTIYTVAGFRHYAGDGAPAGASLLAIPAGVATDVLGNVYIADSNNFRVRKIWRNPPPPPPPFMDPPVPSPDPGSDSPSAMAVRPNLIGTPAVDPTSMISTVAGTGQCGLTGDGGIAAGASILKPRTIATDTAGNLYLGFNGRVRVISVGGMIQTLAGGGSVPGDGGPATAAQLGAIDGIAADAYGTVYLADSTQNVIRKVTPDGRITTIAGGGTVLGDGGPAVAAQLNAPHSLALDAAGNLYVADTLNNRIRKIRTDGSIITVAGAGTYGESGDGNPATAAQLAHPMGIAVDAMGTLYIADNGSGTIRTVTADGIVHTIAGPGTTDPAAAGFNGEGGPALKATFNGLVSLSLDSLGRIYVVDQQNERIRVLSQ